MPFPYSLYKGIAAPQSNSPIDRRDLLDYTGQNIIQSSRYIDPVTHDYVVSTTNHFQGMNAVEQEVTLAVNTKFGSSAQPGFGQNFASIPTISPTIQNQAIGVLQQALATLIQNGSITLLPNLQFSNNGYGQIAVGFIFINNTLGTTVTMSFLLQ